MSEHPVMYHPATPSFTCECSEEEKQGFDRCAGCGRGRCPGCGFHLCTDWPDEDELKEMLGR